VQYTLGMAKRALADANSAFGGSDLVQAVNKAVDALAGMRPWQCLRRTLRFFSTGPVFTLPQGHVGLVRACVNGSPATMRGQDFRFMQSGPGEFPSRRLPSGFAPANVVDLGWSPVMFVPATPFSVVAYADAGVAPSVVLRGVDPTGRETRLSVSTFNAWPVYDETGALTEGVDVAAATPSATTFADVFEASLSGTDEATAAVAFYAVDARDATRRIPLVQYHPKVPAPRFRRYEIQGVRPGQPVELLVESQLEPLPLVNDSDVLPFDGLEPVEWMIRSDWAMKSAEASQAEKYRTAAMQWLQARETRDETRQTQFVVNSVFAGSPGEISMESVNI